MTFDAHNVLPTGEDRVFTTVLHFRDADTLQTALHEAGFAGVEVDGGWHGEDVTAASRLLVVRAGRSSLASAGSGTTAHEPDAR